MLNEKEILQIRDELETCKRPIFFFHDDPDGLASFLLFYRHVKEGKGIVLKARPQLTEMMARKAVEYGADKVFILDIAMVDQEFIDTVKAPVIWIDHHPQMQRERVKYYNSRLKENMNTPVSYMCYQVVKKDEWIALAGCIGDWYMPNFFEEFKKKNKALLDEANKIGEIMYETEFGKLINTFSFNLKGGTSEVSKSVKILTRIDNPQEILEQTTPRGKLIYKKYEFINKTYQELIKRALKAKKGKLLVFTYTEDKLSLTKDLANELIYRFPDRIVVLGREKSGEVRCSIRANKINLPNAIQKALLGVQGYGGGHENACGASIKKEDFKQFLENLEREI